MRALRRTHSTHVTHDRPVWQRDVRLLGASRGISMAGAEAGHIALLALAWHLTGSPSQASLVLLAAVVARTAGAPLAGWIGDHLNRRRVIVASELVVALALMSMAVSQTLPQLLVACLVHAFASMTCGAALDAALPCLVPPGDLTRANSTLGMARTTGHMVGPVLGGLAVAAFGARSAFALDASSSVIAALLVLGIRGRVGGGTESPDEQGPDGNPTADRSMLAGLRVLAGDPILALMAAGWSGMCVCFGIVTAAELPLAVEFGVDEPGLGAIVSCWCAGSLLGSWSARRVQVQRRGPRVLTINALVCALVFAGVGLVPNFTSVLALMAIGGFSMSLADVVQTTLIQSRVEDGVRARVMAAYGGLFSAIWGTNLALAGLIIEAFSPQVAYVYAGSWCLVGALGFIALGGALRREQRAELVRGLRLRHALESELATGA